MIGIDKFKFNFGRKHYAVKDSKALKELLIDDFGFNPKNIFELNNEDATLSKIRSLFENDLPKKLKSNDQLIIFWSGIGILKKQNNGSGGYLIPYDGDPENIYITCFPMLEIERISEDLDNLHTLILLDASNVNLAIGSYSEIKDSKAPFYSYRGIKFKRAREIIVASSDWGTGKDDFEANHNIFTYLLLKGLRNLDADSNQDGVVRTKELLTYLRNEIFKISDVLQQPTYRRLLGDDGGEMFFIRKFSYGVIYSYYGDSKYDYPPPPPSTTSAIQ